MATKKVTVNLPEEQIAFLQKIASEENITVTDAIRRAIKSEEFFVEQEAKGRKVLVEGSGPGKRLREILRK